MLVVGVVHHFTVEQSGDPALVNSLIQMFENVSNVFLTECLIRFREIGGDNIFFTIKI